MNQGSQNRLSIRSEAGACDGCPLRAGCTASNRPNWFDRSFFSESGPATWAKARLVRYADDFVVMARFIDYRIIGFIEERIEHRLGLLINREKTRVVQVKDEDATLEFLGYQFRFSRSHRPGGGPAWSDIFGDAANAPMPLVEGRG